MSDTDADAVKKRLYCMLDELSEKHTVDDGENAAVHEVVMLWRRLKDITAQKARYMAARKRPHEALAAASSGAPSQSALMALAKQMGPRVRRLAGACSAATAPKHSARCPATPRTSAQNSVAALSEFCLRRLLPAILHTDSDYLYLGVTEESRLATWAKNGWKTKAKTTVANSDLWTLIHKLLARRETAGWPTIAFVHVPAHSGIEGNERADRLAGRGCTETKYTLLNASDAQKDTLRSVLSQSFYSDI
jgi:ribonuclease HI